MSKHNGNQPSEIVRYTISWTMNPIQARLATEDEDTWQEAVVISEDDDVIGVLFVPEDTRDDDLPPGRRVWITERWRVLAFPHEAGQVFAIPDVKDVPDSIFGLTDADKLRFILATRIDEPETRVDELVYATITGLDGVERFSIVRRADAEYAAEIAEVVNSCSTWGEVRKVASPQLWEDLLGRTGYGDLKEFTRDLSIGNPVPGAEAYAAQRYAELGYSNPPGDDEPFESVKISGFQDGDYPPATELLQESLLPRSLADEFGHRYETIFNGTFLELSPESGEPIVEAMEELGYRCVEEPELFYAGFLL